MPEEPPGTEEPPAASGSAASARQRMPNSCRASKDSPGARWRPLPAVIDFLLEDFVMRLFQPARILRAGGDRESGAGASGTAAAAGIAPPVPRRGRAVRRYQRKRFQRSGCAQCRGLSQAGVRL